jgi:hypothetical protein|tara:strand:- start:33 stop:338 length:306 start_codon:yes stop_codon:yes gene_type:complete
MATIIIQPSIPHKTEFDEDGEEVLKYVVGAETDIGNKMKHVDISTIEADIGGGNKIKLNLKTEDVTISKAGIILNIELRELDYCDTDGNEKKILVLASQPY